MSCSSTISFHSFHLSLSVLLLVITNFILQFLNCSTISSIYSLCPVICLHFDTVNIVLRDLYILVLPKLVGLTVDTHFSFEFPICVTKTLSHTRLYSTHLQVVRKTYTTPTLLDTGHFELMNYRRRPWLAGKVSDKVVLNYLNKTTCNCHISGGFPHPRVSLCLN